MSAKRVQPHLGRNQRLAMGVLFDHGVWAPGMPYGIGTDSKTDRVMCSLIGRHLAKVTETGEARYCLTMAGYAWLIRDASDSLAMTEFGSEASEAVEQRIRHLATCSRLVGAHNRPVDWRGNPV
jgi:hypothetical protein